MSAAVKRILNIHVLALDAEIERLASEIKRRKGTAHPQSIQSAHHRRERLISDRSQIRAFINVHLEGTK